MIISLSGRERNAYQVTFNRLFRLRHDVFIAGRHWTLPNRGDLDIDQYDTPDAQYFFSMGDDGSIHSHVRITPSETHSLLADYFPHLVERPHTARGHAIYEATRYIILPRDRSRCSIKRAKAKLLAAVIEWAYVSGLTHVQTVIDAAALPGFIEITGECRPLGLSHAYGGGPAVRGGGEAVAVRCPVTLNVIRDIREFGGLPCGFCQPCAAIEERLAA